MAELDTKMSSADSSDREGASATGREPTSLDD